MYNLRREEVTRHPRDPLFRLSIEKEGGVSGSFHKKTLNLLNKIFTHSYPHRVLHKRRHVFSISNGFTLAEVLVTLAIIGVVAALTIPTLMSSIENAGTASRVKKANSMLSQVIKMYMVDNNCIGDLAACGLYAGDREHQVAWNALKPYFKVLKDCGITTGEGKCFPQNVMYKNLNGSDYNILDNISTFLGAKGVLTDGMLIMIQDEDGNCTLDRSRTGQTPLKYVCGAIIIDTNGQKGPNQFGKDIFVWNAAKNGIVYPSGSLDHSSSTATDGTPHCDPAGGGNWDDSGGGWGCTAKIIREGKVNY